MVDEDLDWLPETEEPRPRPPWTPLEFPPQIRWGVRRGASIAERPKGRNGKRLCGWCDNELPKYRRSWCGNACAEKFQRVWSWGALRIYIIGRDRTCQRCGREWPGWQRTRTWRGYSGKEGEQCRLERATWQVDHILPVQDGGTDDPRNLRLLCHDCHIEAGYEQRHARHKSLVQMQLQALDSADVIGAMKATRFPPELAGVAVLLEDHELVYHPRDFRCPFEEPHQWNRCGKVKRLPWTPEGPPFGQKPLV